MDEEDKEKPEESEKEGTESNDVEGVQQETISELDRADQIAERQKRENNRREELLKREEALEAIKKVGGEIEAGQKPVKKEESPKEYNERIDKEISEGKHGDE